MHEQRTPQSAFPNYFRGRRTIRAAAIVGVAASLSLMGCDSQTGSAEGGKKLTVNEQLKAMYPLGCDIVSARDKGADLAAPQKRDLVSMRLRVPRNTNVPRQDVTIISQNHLTVRPVHGVFQGFSYWRDYDMMRDKKILDNATIHEGKVSAAAPTQGAELVIDRDVLNRLTGVDIFGVATMESKNIEAKYYCGRLAITGTPEAGIAAVDVLPNDRTPAFTVAEKPG